MVERNVELLDASSELCTCGNEHRKRVFLDRYA